MEWHLPFTLMSAVALLVMSTATFITGLNAEIHQLENEAARVHIISLKLAQLKRLSRSIMLQYISLFLFVISSIVIAFWTEDVRFAKVLVLLGVILTGAALAILIMYSFRAITIRQEHLRPNKPL